MIFKYVLFDDFHSMLPSSLGKTNENKKGEKREKEKRKEGEKE